MASEAPTTVVVKRRSTGWRIATWLFGILAVLLLLIVALVFGINTGPGRAFLVRQFSGFETASGMGVQLDRIDGSLYGKLQIVGLKITDPKGVFLESPRIDLDWRPFAYLGNKVDVRSLASPQIRLLRTPEFKPVPSDPNAPLLPDLDVTVGRLAIDRFEVEAPVTGQRHIVRLVGTADIADGRARVDADARALRAAGVAGGDVAIIKLDAVPEANKLQIDARVTAPAGGLVDSYAGTGRPMLLTIGGNGDWKTWDGRVQGTLGGQPLANLALTARNGTFSLKGNAMPAVYVQAADATLEEAQQAPLARLTAPALAIDATAALADRSANVNFSAKSDAMVVTGKGLVDLGQSRLGNFMIAGALLKPGSIADSLSGRDVKFAAVLDGPFATPTVAYRLNAAQIAFGTMGVSGLAAQGSARVDADRILVPVNATAERVTGLNAAAGGLLEKLSINGDLAYTDGRLLSDNLKLKSSQIDATAIVLADIANGKYTGAIKGRVNDYRIAGLGRLSLVTDAELVQGATGGFGIRGSFRATTRRLENEALANVLGGDAVTIARFGFDENGTASLVGLRMTAPGFRVTDAKGSYNLDSGRIAFDARAVSREYGPLSVNASGTLERPLVNLRAAKPGLGVGLRDIQATLRGVPAGYAVVGRGNSDYGPFNADVTIRTGALLAVDIKRATFAGIDFNGTVQQTRAGPFAGRLALAGSGLNGGIVLAAAGANQRADIDVTANAASIPGVSPITIGSGHVRATAIMLPNGPSVNGAFQLADVRQGEMIVERAQGKIDYRDGNGKLALVANGNAGVPFDVAGQAAMTPTRIVANLKGSANTIAFNLTRPAVITKEGADWVLAPTTLVIPQGKVDLNGRFGARTEAHARLANMDVAIAQAFVPGLGLGGRASGTLDYVSAGAVPTVKARLDIARFTRTAAYVVSDPVDIAFLGTLDDTGGDLRALIRRGGANVGRMQARLAPLGEGAGLSDRMFGAPLSGGIRYSGPADVLWTLTGISGQTLSGPIAIAADFGGRLSQPTITGLMRAKTLRYENETFGTVISNIALDGRFTQSRLELVSLTGRAGTGGVSASGNVGLDAASGFPIDLTAKLDRAQLARSDALGATATGTVRVLNGPNGGSISGEINIPNARYQIVLQGAAEVAELEGVRRRTDKPGQAKVQQASAFSTNFKLDLRIRAENEIFVSGMGLEAEWAADMRITGTANAPRVVGQLDVVRGTYSFSGRRFDLDESGLVRFNGPLLDPELNLAASTTVEGVSAIINIGGRAQAPQITFTSTPTLPQDEVLSRLLFGSSVTSLSPTQAIQLAAALNSLRGGGGGGLNPLGKLRSATGIDRLRVLGADKTAGRGTALAAGQYISNDIYVEIITDARGFTATQLEISLSKTLSLLSQAASFGGSNVNLRYSKDY